MNPLLAIPALYSRLHVSTCFAVLVGYVYVSSLSHSTVHTALTSACGVSKKQTTQHILAFPAYVTNPPMKTRQSEVAHQKSSFCVFFLVMKHRYRLSVFSYLIIMLFSISTTVRASFFGKRSLVAAFMSPSGDHPSACEDIELPQREYGYAKEPFTWPHLVDIIAEPNLAKLSRSVDQERQYQIYRRELLKEWVSSRIRDFGTVDTTSCPPCSCASPYLAFVEKYLRSHFAYKIWSEKATCEEC